MTGLEIKDMKIGKVKIDAAARRIEAQMARDAAEWTAQRAVQKRLLLLMWGARSKIGTNEVQTSRIRRSMRRVQK
jgi:membrane-bound lytic murein transglycosylase B